MKRINEAGNRYGRLLVVGYSGLKCEKSHWMCKCDCGKEKVIAGCSLRSGGTKSCGCFGKESNSERMKIHGMYGTPEYNTWSLMKRRCFVVDDKDYHNYGGRGIKVCDRWVDSFENFFADMGERHAGLTMRSRLLP